MKKITLLALLLIGTILAFAQETKPAKGDWGLGFRVQGLGNVLLGEFDSDVFGNPQLLARRYITNRIAIRTTFGVSVQNDESRFESSFLDFRDGQSVRIDSAFRSTSSQLSISLAPGAEYHLLSTASKLDPYVGFSIPVGYLGNTTQELDEEFRVTNNENGEVLFNSDLATNTELDGGLSFGFSMLAGFNYFFSSNMAIGAEYNLGLLINDIGGNFRQRVAGSIQPTPDPSVIQNVDTEITGRIEESATNVGLSTVGVNLSIFW